MTRLQQAYRGGYNGRSGWWLHFHFDEDAIAFLKAYDHGTERAWDPDTKRWWISDDIAEQVAEFLPQLEMYMKQPELGL